MNDVGRHDGAIGKASTVGGGTSGWSSALGLSERVARSALSGTIIEAPDISVITTGEANIPKICAVGDRLGAKESAFDAACNAVENFKSRSTRWTI